MNNDKPATPLVDSTTHGPWRRLAIAFAVGVLVAALPLVFLLFQSNQARSAAARDLRVAELELSLARATVLARSGDYATARDEASAFFTLARTEVDRQTDSLDGPRLAALKTVLAERDPIITLLARSDPASAERLSQLYLSYRAASPQR